MSYLKDNFLFENETAVKLYETYVKDMPIFGIIAKQAGCLTCFFYALNSANVRNGKKTKPLRQKP